MSSTGGRGSGGEVRSVPPPLNANGSTSATMSTNANGSGSGAGSGPAVGLPSSSSGFFRQRNGSGMLSSGFSQPTSSLFDRFRRPRTATNASFSAAGGAGQQRQAQSAAAASTGATDYTNVSSDDLTANIIPSATHGGRVSSASPRNGIPRSSSSSQVHLPFSNSTNSVDGAGSPAFSGNRRPGMHAHGASQSQSNIRFTSKSSNMNGVSSSNAAGASAKNGSGSSLGFPLLSRTGSSHGANGPGGSTGGVGSSSGFGRMFRRYSQGAGRNQAAANEAHALAAASTGAESRGNGTPTAIVNESSLANSSAGHSGGGSRQSNGDSGNPPSSNHDASSSADATSNALAGMALSTDAGPSAPDTIQQQQSQAHRIRLVPHLEATRSLHFEPIERDLLEGSMAVKIGRFTDRGQSASANANAADTTALGGSALGPGSTIAGSNLLPQSTSTGALQPLSSGTPGARGGAIPSATGGASRVDAGRIAFKSKVVSRGHAEIWCESGGKVFVRDTKSSSGTFLNHIRLSAPNVESKPFQLKDGDVVQLGVDYQGGTEEIYRCVKMRIELNRGWQRGANQFNVNALRQLRALQGSPLPDPATVAASKGKSDAAVTPTSGALPTNRQSLNVTDCCICLFSVTVCQALFIAPCSHVFHYKCIRPLLNMHHPGFSCPLCRTFADLEADVEEDDEWQQALLQEAEASSRAEVAGTPLNELPVPSLVAIAVASSNSSDAEHFVDAHVAPHSAAPSMLSHNEHTVILNPQTRSSDSSPFIRRGSASVEDSPSSASYVRRSSARRSSSRDASSPLRRPDTAVSSTTAVPPSSMSAARNGSPSSGSRHNSRRPSLAAAASGLADEESQEMLHEDRRIGAALMYEQGRRPSNPIDISSSHSASQADGTHPSTAHFRHLQDGFTASPGLSDARTPQNEHFLSTLAEAPPPTRSALRPS